MAAIIELPDDLAQRLERMAEEHGETIADLVQRLAAEYVSHSASPEERSREVKLPLIPATTSGTIGPFTGTDIDELFTEEDIAPRH